MIRAARRVGCEIGAGAFEPIQVAGETVYAGTVRCRDNAHAVELLNALADDDAVNDTDLVRFVHGMRLTNEPAEVRARAIHRFVKEHVSFSEESGERFRLPSLTLRLGTGDCDDSAHLIASMAMAMGLGGRVVLLPNMRGEWTHVVAQIGYGGAWHWAEATFDADYDEHPHDAARRLGIMRGDVL